MADEGASPRELILEACRRNNTSLLEEVVHDLESKAKAAGKEEHVLVAETLNTATDGIGQGALHVAASCGSYEVLDLLLDQEGLEIELLDRLEKDTPLHKAVRYVNGLDKEEWEHGHPIVEILIDAGCDPRIRNKAKLRPVDLVDPRNTALRDILKKAEFTLLVGDDVVQEDDDDGPTGSASDSD